MTNRKKYITLIAVLALVAAVFFAYLASNGFYGIGSDGENVEIDITEGMHGGAIADVLKQNGIIKNEFFFKAALRLSRKASAVKVGQFVLNPKMSYREIINMLTNYSNDGLIKITIPEGYRISQIAELLDSNGLADKEEFEHEVAYGIFDYDFIKADALPDDSRLEGYLFPDTYLFSKTTSAHEIITTMLDEFENEFSENIKKAAANQGLTNEEAVILASIIEKEGKEEEFTTISSVFRNRLNNNMRLESCATVNYLLDEPKDTLSVDDTYIDSPYNTYRNGGLPPAPICSPGLAALEAAVNPADTDYMYFVADGNGGNLFSVTYEEHLKKKGEVRSGG